MEVIPVTTRIMHPPQDDLFAVLDEYLTQVQEGDIVVVSSKVVAISEGRCLPIERNNKQELVQQEADVVIPRSYWSTPLTIIKNAFIGTAGIDESNADGHYILLPKDTFASAQQIHMYLIQKHALTNVGVIITDSHSTPLRRGAMGIAIGWWGFQPLINHVGQEDLFARKLQLEVSNLVDGLAASANVVMGETNECQPIVIMRDVPNLTFTKENTRDELLVPFKEDTFRVLYERFLK